jgi:rhodanese-related sulfurtransferase
MTEPLRISAADAKGRVDTGKAIVLDVVSPAAWDALDVAIAGAVRIPPDQLDARFAGLPKDRTIVAYCTWPNEHTSARVAQELRRRGYTAYALVGGLHAWLEAGYPSESKQVEMRRTVADVCPDCGLRMAEHIHLRRPSPAADEDVLDSAVTRMEGPSK